MCSCKKQMLRELMQAKIEELRQRAKSAGIPVSDYCRQIICTTAG